jgi:uncharacterized heparinase superfamily protein
MPTVRGLISVGAVVKSMDDVIDHWRAKRREFLDARCWTAALIAKKVIDELENSKRVVLQRADGPSREELLG